MRIVTIPRTAFVVLVSATLAHAQQLPNNGQTTNSPATGTDPQPVPTGTQYLLEEIFEDGLGLGWTATGLWHVTDTVCVDAGVCGEDHWAYFGIDASCDFDTGEPVEGNLTSPIVFIPDDAPAPFLFFCSAYNGERGMAPTDGDFPNGTTSCEAPSNFDAIWVSVAGESGTYVEDIGCRKQNVDEWEKRMVDLSMFRGENVFVAFSFDSMDNVNNNLTGWLIDKVVIGDGNTFVVAADSVKDHDGVGGLPIDVIDGTEPRSGGLTELQVTFSADVEAEDGEFSDLDDVALVGAGTITDVVANGNVLTMQVSGVEDRACVTFEFPGVVDAIAGLPVEGAVSVASHFGDVNGDNIADESDVVLAEESSAPDAIASQAHARGDIDLDGFRIVGDVALAKAAMLQVETLCP